MRRFRDVLLYAEVEDAACLAQVEAFVAAHDASLTVCQVVPAPPQIPDSRGVIERLSKLRWSRAFQKIRAVCANFPEHMMIDYSVFIGEPYVAITDQVLEQGFDLVVHISEPAQAAAAVGLNATGMHLMRKCPATVWSLHPSDAPQSKDVVLALDRELAAQATAADAFSLSLAEAAISVAQARGGCLHVVHAWQPYGSELLSDLELGLSHADIAFHSKQQSSATEQWFRRLVQRIESLAPEGLELKPRLLQGDVLQRLSELLDTVTPGVMVLGTVGTSVNPGVLIGATTESLLASSGTSVITLKPPGYRSPLSMQSPRTAA